MGRPASREHPLPPSKRAKTTRLLARALHRGRMCEGLEWPPRSRPGENRRLVHFSGPGGWWCNGGERYDARGRGARDHAALIVVVNRVARSVQAPPFHGARGRAQGGHAAHPCGKQGSTRSRSQRPQTSPYGARPGHVLLPPMGRSIATGLRQRPSRTVTLFPLSGDSSGYGCWW